jgi:hypothetical protein
VPPAEEVQLLIRSKNRNPTQVELHGELAVLTYAVLLMLFA